jgi:hypothetical protein
MISTIQYTCESCGKVHDRCPALTYLSPSNYHYLSDSQKEAFGKISDDFCTIEYPQKTDKFIRVVLNQKVIDHCDNLEYGLWVSLSDKSFDDYFNNFKNDNHITQYFGWLSSDLPDYDFKESIPTTVITKPGNQRPEIVPHQDFDHPFIRDYYNGITKDEAEKRINDMLDSIQ